MKNVPRLVKFIPIFVAGALVLPAITQLNAEPQSGQVTIQAVSGSATYSTGGAWLPLKENLSLSRGAAIKTADGATVDLILTYNGTVLRLTPNSELRLN